ncbi:hypothetical protein [Nannocystis pusilla]|uniref:hypothetical protein n=1 Tax=Nannocystis pusilla TaxID=889268 RepID=UPI003DA5DCDC
MNRKSFTAILLGGALAGGCSKPNPLFLDTWDVITDSGSVSQTSAVTLETTTIEPPTTSDPPVTTTSTATSTSTITSSSDNTTTTGPNPTTETTGEGFVCDGVGVDMEGCCEVKVLVAADTFLSDATDGVNGECMVTQPPKLIDCVSLSFGELKGGFLSKDDGTVSAVEGITVMALQFPTEDGQLVSEANGPIPTGSIASLRLEVQAEYNQALYGDQMQFSFHALDAGLGWTEGGSASECADGFPSFTCRQCGAMVGDDCVAWWHDEEMKPVVEVLQPLAVVDTVGEAGVLKSIDLAPLGSPADWVPKIVGGSLVVAPRSATFNGMDYKEKELFPAPGIAFHTRESDTPPRLVARVCKP